MMRKQQTKHTQTKVELNAQQWLQLLSGTYSNGSNGNGHAANSTAPEYPVTQLPAEYWLRILSGAQPDPNTNGNGHAVNGAQPAEIDAKYWLHLLGGAGV